MPIDTADKRASALSRRRFTAPTPDSTVSDADRAHLARTYRGITPLAIQINTRDKRASIIGLRQPWRQIAPNPAGDTINAYDRKQLAGLYRDEEAGIGAFIQASAGVVSAQLTTEIPLAASLTAEASTTGTLVGALQPLEAELASVATLSAGLTTAIRLRATLEGRASITADFNRAPVLLGTPAPMFIQGTAGTYSIAAFAMDPDNDPLVAVLSQGPFGLQAGVTYDQANKRFVYDGTHYGLLPGATLETPFHRIVYDDSQGFSVLARSRALVPGANLELLHFLNATLLAEASLTGILETPVSVLDATIRAEASIVADLTIGAGLTALIAGEATVEGTLEDTIPLESLIVCNASIEADLFTQGSTALAVLLDSETVVVADLSTGIQLAATIQAEASLVRTGLGPSFIFEAVLGAVAFASGNLSAPGLKGAWFPEDPLEFLPPEEPLEDTWVKEGVL